MTTRKFREGLEIFEKYCEDTVGHFCAEHDELFIYTDHPVEEPDRQRLLALGFRWDDHLES